MITRRGRLAFANARVRAFKSRLLERDDGRRAPRATRRVLADDGFAELIEWYHCVLESYPFGQPLVEAMLRRHEAENVKLAWRVVAGRHPFARWSHLWLQLGALQTLDRESVRDAVSLTSLVASLQHTPYATAAADMLRAHAGDPLAAEMSLERWLSRRLLEACRMLPAPEQLARKLVCAVVRMRDLDVVRRASMGLGPEPDAAVNALALWPLELKAAELARLAAWHPADGPLWAVLPRAFDRRRSRPAEWDALALVWRIERRDLCRRAFLEQPFALAPAVAVLLLKEEEIRGLRAG